MKGFQLFFLLICHIKKLFNYLNGVDILIDSDSQTTGFQSVDTFNILQQHQRALSLVHLVEPVLIIDYIQNHETTQTISRR